MMVVDDSDQELLDLVDASDQVVGTILRGQATTPGGLPKDRYIRAANCFIMNAKQQLWIPRRTTHKKIAPGGLDYSAGGHVTSGQSYEEAMRQELVEEVNLHLDPKQLIEIGLETPFNTPPYIYFAKIFLYLSDEAPDYNPDDFTGFEWLSVEELQQKLRNGVSAKDSLLAATESVSAYLRQHEGDKQRDK